MVELVSLPVNLRSSLGKKATRAERRDNRVPAIIYGNNEQNIPISIEGKQLDKLLQSSQFFTQIFDSLNFNLVQCMLRFFFSPRRGNDFILIVGVEIIVIIVDGNYNCEIYNIIVENCKRSQIICCNLARIIATYRVNDN